MTAPQGCKASMMAMATACLLLTWPGMSIANAAGTGRTEADGLAAKIYAPRTNWSEPSGSKLNISSFVFRDVNRNGTYDLPDRPMENVAVVMTTPDREQVMRWSNFNGFANFSMSPTQPDAVITGDGDHVFDVVVPPGWSATTDNLKQKLAFRRLPGSVADIVGNPPFRPVGLAPDLAVKGRVVLPDSSAERDNPEINAFAIDPSGRKQPLPLDSTGRFSFLASKGLWTIEVIAPHATLRREVEVRNVASQLAAIRLEEPPPKAGHIRLIDFEAVTKRRIREVPNGTGGVNWWNMVAYKAKQGYANNSVSGAYVTYNSSGHPARISHPQGFDFVGSHFGVAWKKANGETLVLKGWRGDTLIYQDEIVLSDLGPVWFDAEYRNITRLDLQTKHYWQFVADDIQLRLKN